MSNRGIVSFDTQHHVRIPGYKHGYGDGSNGFEVRAGHPPKPIGSFWMKVSQKRDKSTVRRYELTFIPEIVEPKI